MNTPYDLIGGDNNVRELAVEFYSVMSKNPRFKSLRNMHAKDLSKVSEDLYMFLSGWLGGPHLYYQKHKTLCLDKPHRKFEITEKDRDLWLDCMHEAMNNVGLSEEVKSMVRAPLYDLADTIRNK